MRKGLLQFGWLILALGFFSVRATAAAPIVWNEKQKTFDADISSIGLRDLLARISQATGWEVYMEPGSAFSTSAKFKNLSRTDALRILLGNLSFQIAPQSNSVPKLFVFRTGAENATQLVRAEKHIEILGKNKIILNHLILTLKPGSGENINALAQQLGGKIIGRVEGTDSYLLEFTDEAAAKAAREQLARVDGVASVDSNYSVDRPAPVSIAGVDRSVSNSPFTLKPGVGGGDGKQIVIGMIDTAVQQLAANMQGFLLPSMSVAGEAHPDPGNPTHGTAMAESMLFGLNSTAPQGQASSVKIQVWDVYGDSPTTSTFNIANGIVQAVNNGANIISVSSGTDGNSDFLETLTKQVTDKGIPIIAAAGNQPVTTPVYPAAYSGVIAVTSAQDQRGTIASYANRGDFVDIILPGGSVFPFNGLSFYANGTSVSTALASGMMAGLAESTRQSPAQLVPTFTRTLAFKR
ncbi:MAG: S8 family serine peptidase [Verrucomicrobiota bacterium]